MEEKQRDTFKSQFGVIMSMAGLAIGLGNCWRFPYLCGKWGGGSFVFAYVIGCFLIVLPLAIVEVGIGKGVKRGCMDVYEISMKNPIAGKAIGGVTAFCQWAQNFYYLAIVAAILYFIYVCLNGVWNTVPSVEIYDKFQANQVLFIALYVIVFVFIIYTGLRGIGKGVERISKIMVPMMFVLFLITFILTCVFTPNITQGLKYYLWPDVSKLSNPGLWSAAIAQALFSVGVGPGALLVYGSHIRDDGEVTKAMTITCLMDTFAGLLAGLTIIPACVAKGIDPESGSTLIFRVLPEVFRTIPGGTIIGTILFMGMLCAAVTSALSNQECAVTTFSDGFSMDRKKVLFIMGGVNLLFGILCICSVKVMDFWQIVTGDYTFLPSAALGGITFSYLFGVKKIREQFVNPNSPVKLGRWFDRWIQFVAVPVMLFFMVRTFVGLFI